MFFRLLFALPTDAHSAQIDCEVKCLIGKDFIPHFPHIIHPTNVIDDENRFLVRLIQ
jgi:hypothetical protein